MRLISSSIAWTPKRVGVPSPLLPSGSMKWFMPPILEEASNRQAETHDPSTVCTSAGSRLAKTPPM